MFLSFSLDVSKLVYHTFSFPLSITKKLSLSLRSHALLSFLYYVKTLTKVDGSCKKVVCEGRGKGLISQKCFLGFPL